MSGVYGSVAVWLNDDLYLLTGMYIRTVRSPFLTVDSNDVDNIFISSNGGHKEQWPCIDVVTGVNLCVQDLPEKKASSAKAWGMGIRTAQPLQLSTGADLLVVQDNVGVMVDEVAANVVPTIKLHYNFFEVYT
ncbi:hypothetical protein ACROYT_G015212 [Oculina patagonica]